MLTLTNPSHPGEVLKELFLDPLELSAGALARCIEVPRTRIERLVKGETAVTTDTALRLSAAFANTPEFWMNLQHAYDIAHVRPAVDLSRIKPLVKAA